MEISKEEKIRAINYVKAITIILMVASHYTSSPLNRLAPYMYHMPLFFFLGGMLFNHTKSLKEHYSKVFFKHFTYIVLTYIIVGVMALCIYRLTGAPVGVIFEDSIFSTIKKTINDGFSNNRYFLASWFLFSYMIIMLFAPFICRLLHKTSFPMIAGVILAFSIGWVGIEITSINYHQVKNIALNYLTQCLVGGMFFILGFSIKKHLFKFINELTFLLVIITTIILYGLGIIYVMGMSWSIYKLGFFFTTLGALLGIYCIFYISIVLAKAVSFKWLEFIGEGSKDIMAYHLVAFSLLNIAAWKLYNFDISRNDILHSFSNEWSWIPYLILGVTLPLGVTKIYNIFNALALHK
ncbi:TPA: acyltransferase [Morganella morganii]|nr:acyltransferase [Morganella morganii]